MRPVPVPTPTSNLEVCVSFGIRFNGCDLGGEYGTSRLFVEPVVVSLLRSDRRVPRSFRVTVGSSLQESESRPLYPFLLPAEALRSLLQGHPRSGQAVEVARAICGHAIADLDVAEAVPVEA
jgi:hypothetical protein